MVGTIVNIHESLKQMIDSGVFITTEDKGKLEDIIVQLDTIYKAPISKVSEEREKQYENYRTLITSYGRLLGETSFRLLLTREEYLFLKNQILKEIKLTRENLILAQVVRNDFFYTLDSEKKPNKTAIFKGDVTVETFPVNITEITRISHLNSFIAISCTDPNADNYVNIIKKIGDLNKIFEVFNKAGDVMSDKGGNWVQGFDVFDNEV